MKQARLDNKKTRDSISADGTRQTLFFTNGETVEIDLTKITDERVRNLNLLYGIKKRAMNAAALDAGTDTAECVLAARILVEQQESGEYENSKRTRAVRIDRELYLSVYIKTAAKINNLNAAGKAAFHDMANALDNKELKKRVHSQPDVLEALIKEQKARAPKDQKRVII